MAESRDELQAALHGMPSGFWCVGWLPESLGLLDQSSEFEGGTPAPIFRHVQGCFVS